MPEKSILEELQASFPKSGKSDWLYVASTEVNGSNALEKLAWNIDGNNFFHPYFDKSDTESLVYQTPFNFTPDSDGFSGARAWANLPAVIVKEEKETNAMAIGHLMKGGDGILFHVPQNVLHLPALLDKIEWPFCNLSFVAANEIMLLQTIGALFQSESYDPEKIRGSVFLKGRAVLSEKILTPFASFSNFHASGIFISPASVVQEIAGALSEGVIAVDKMILQGFSKETAIRNIAFSIPVDSRFLTGISKLKVLRMLWFQIAQAYGYREFKPDDLHIHARQEAWTHEQYQPHGNMLNATVASIASICGGCNSLTAYAENETSSLMQRMARNTSILLREESYFNKVADPTAGAYAIDVMTDQLAKKSWQMFQSLIS